ncbi:hypothetical protein EGH24_01490 [Halonotius terrestris]|uniref:Uncharacterized protein n=1 Tax=Halonotius terrestris TaxID=2487750 RepID=A0A8J8PF20_9EURY|nr:DUF5809 family protein [Halonotius terrestris]TQQ83492.1 hypothetical protein EGH24_01490 [Halonotius terrestris]
MEIDGIYAPETADDAGEAYESLGSTAQIVVKETAKAMELSNDEYAERVTSEVIETARDALFASLLEVFHGDRDAFEAWCDDHPEYTVERLGSDNVDSVVWHPIPFAETVIAATYQDEPAAAAATVRRRAFGEQYRPAF